MSRSHPHSRQPSADTTSVSSAPAAAPAYQLILDHILTYPGSYEIPLRTMYTLNCAPGGQPPNAHHSSSSTSSFNSSEPSPNLAQGAWHDKQATQAFTENLMAQISNLSNQPSSLPPSFITSFLRRSFPSELIEVDFPQALTGLDYLKDLETRRRREVASAMARLAIDAKTLAEDPQSLAQYPGALPWIQKMEAMERKVDHYYSVLYVGLRRWIMINELSLLPFNIGNCYAMLNTLYPPPMAAGAQPTARLTPDMLKEQRNGFFKYITQVEQKGPRVLSLLMQQGSAPGDVNGWVAVTRALSNYLQLANSCILDCSDIVDLQDIASHEYSEPQTTTKTVRKADSGISFGSTDSRKPPSQPLPKEPGSPTQPLPSEHLQPAQAVQPSLPKAPSANRGGTALEKLARGLRTIGRSRVDATEIISDPVAQDKPRGLRKMRSMGALDRSSKSISNRKLEVPAFDEGEMRRQRMKYEAGLMAEQKFGGRQKAHEF